MDSEVEQLIVNGGILQILNSIKNYSKLFQRACLQGIWLKVKENCSISKSKSVWDPQNQPYFVYVGCLVPKHMLSWVSGIPVLQYDDQEPWRELISRSIDHGNLNKALGSNKWDKRLRNKLKLWWSGIKLAWMDRLHQRAMPVSRKAFF